MADQAIALKLNYIQSVSSLDSASQTRGDTDFVNDRR
jgi:hypothetical protein